MEDYSAGHIKDSVAKKLIDFLKESINDEIFELFSGVSYRHILVWKGGSLSPITVPPHDITGKNITATGNTILGDGLADTHTFTGNITASNASFLSGSFTSVTSSNATF